MIALWRRSYGAHPLHLLSLLGCFALAGWAVLQAAHGPLPLRMAGWFVGALIGHDLVVFPLYALADRSLSATLRRRAPSLPPAGSVNYLRVPTMLSGLLLLIFFPLILRKNEGPYRAAAGLDSSVYLGRWLLITAVAFAVSAAIFVVRARRSPR